MILHLWVIAFIAGVYLRPGELIPALSGVPVMDYLAGGGLILALGSLAIRPRLFFNQPHDLFFLGYYAILVASNPLNGFFTGGIVGLTNFSTVAIAYYLIRLGNRTQQQVRRTAVALVLLTLFLAVNGLLQIYTGVGVGGVTAADTREGARIMGTGIFSDANDLGMAMVTIIPLVLSVVLGKSGFIFRTLNAAALVVLLMACYYTNSRGTIIGLGVVFSIFTFRRFGLFTAATLSAIGFAAIIAFGPSRMADVSSSGDSSQGRIQAWAAAVDMFQSSPFWGVGYGQFTEHHERAAHNSLMHATGELGIIGAVMFVGMFYWYFMGLRPALVAESKDSTAGTPERTNGPKSRYMNNNGPTRTNGKPNGSGGGASTRSRGAPHPEADGSATRDFSRRLARDLSDCGIGMLSCAMFLSRQYTVTMFIPLALSASFAAALIERPEPEPNERVRHLLTVPVLAVGLIIFVWVGVKVFVRY